jgi:type II secretory pathway pseudopilin PulG
MIKTRKYRTLGALATQAAVLGCISLFAGSIVVPSILSNAASEERAQVTGDLRRLTSDVMNYFTDTGLWPKTGSFGFTDGNAAAGEDGCFGRETDGRHVSQFLATNDEKVRNWRGPYMSVRRGDPWGNRYVVVIDRKRSAGTARGWVLSAGPNGVFETRGNDAELGGDDVGFPVR